MKILLVSIVMIAVVSCNKSKNNFGRQFLTMIDQLSEDSTELFGKYPINKPNVFIIDPPLDGTNTNTLIVTKDTSILFRASIEETSSRSASMKTFEQYHQKIDHILDNSFKRDYEDIIPLTGYTNRTYRFTSKKIEIELKHVKSILDNKYDVSLHVSNNRFNEYSILDSVRKNQ